MTRTGAKKEDTSSDFSKFFREASSAEKKKVFLDVAKKQAKSSLRSFGVFVSLTKIAETVSDNVD